MGCAPAAKNKSEKNRCHCFCQFSGLVIGQDWLLFLLTTLLYHLLIHKSKQNTNILAPKFVIFLFVYIFSVFFPAKKKFRQKLACAQLSAKIKQLNTKKFCAFNF